MYVRWNTKQYRFVNHLIQVTRSWRKNWFGGPRNKPREQRKDMFNMILFMGMNWVKQSNNPIRIPNKFPGILTALEPSVFYRLP